VTPDGAVAVGAAVQGSVLSGEKLVRLPFVCKDFARRFFARHKR